MRWLRIAFLGALFGCGSDDERGDTGNTLTVGMTQTTMPGTSDAGDDAASMSTGGATTSTTVLTDATSSEASEDGSTLADADASSSGGGVDCTAPADCAECWTCAAQGPCMAQYQSCESMFNCAPALVCLQSQCTADGLTQDCASTCCMSCENLMTCPMVDAVMTCIEQQCAGSCGAVTCP
jgi:hypothetical protein